MPMRPCLGVAGQPCGRLHRNRSRCDTCQAAYDHTVNQARGSATARGYDAAWQQVSREAIARHRRLYGDICPGWKKPPHRAKDLTADHIVPKAQGGTDTADNVQVLCRSCNSAKGSR